MGCACPLPCPSRLPGEARPPCRRWKAWPSSYSGPGAPPASPQAPLFPAWRGLGVRGNGVGWGKQGADIRRRSGIDAQPTAPAGAWGGREARNLFSHRPRGEEAGGRGRAGHSAWSLFCPSRGELGEPAVQGRVFVLEALWVASGAGREGQEAGAKGLSSGCGPTHRGGPPSGWRCPRLGLLIVNTRCIHLAPLQHTPEITPGFLFPASAPVS